MITQAEHENMSHGPELRCHACPETQAHETALRNTAEQLRVKPTHGVALLVSLFLWALIILGVDALIDITLN